MLRRGGAASEVTDEPRSPRPIQVTAPARRGSVLFAGFMGAGLGDAVYEVDQAVVIDTAMLAQADLAGAAGGNAFAAMLHRVLERAQ